MDYVHTVYRQIIYYLFPSILLYFIYVILLKRKYANIYKNTKIYNNFTLLQDHNNIVPIFQEIFFCKFSIVLFSRTSWNPDQNKSACMNYFSCIHWAFRASPVHRSTSRTLIAMDIPSDCLPADLLLSLHFNIAVHRDTCLPPLQLPRTSEGIYWKMEIGDDWYAISLFFIPSCPLLKSHMTMKWEPDYWQALFFFFLTNKTISYVLDLHGKYKHIQYINCHSCIYVQYIQLISIYHNIHNPFTFILFNNQN